MWVAQPEATRHGASAFVHHADLPRVELDAAEGTVFAGALGDISSPAAADTPLVGVDLALRPGTTVVPTSPTFEHAVVALDGPRPRGPRGSRAGLARAGASWDRRAA